MRKQWITLSFPLFCVQKYSKIIARCGGVFRQICGEQKDKNNSFWTRYTHTHEKKKYRPPERRKTASGISGLYCVVGQDYGKDGARFVGR